MSKEIIHSDLAPAAVGPYIQGAKLGNVVFTSGQLGIDVNTGEFAGSDVAAQAHQSMKNLGEVLKAAGSDYKKIVRTLIFLTDMNDFAVVNEIYQSYFDGE
ncbi:MAG: Rid family detoxifying hydrolase, partial [Erysipelotrichaceae bacterium]